MRRWKALFTLCCVLLIGLPLHVAADDDAAVFEVEASKYLMGTLVEMKIMAEDVSAAKAAMYEAFIEMSRVEHLLSAHIEESEIARVNAHASQQPVPVSAETFAILERAISFSEKCDGMFDISIGAVSEVWGFNEENREIQVPATDTLDSLLTQVDYRAIELNPTDTTVVLAKPGAKLDLGGIAKGYAIDRAAAVLKQLGVKHFMINAGGDIFAGGSKYGDIKWSVGVKHPRQPDELFAKMEMEDYAVATSGDYERYAMIDGKRYHHILNPQTGYPSRHCQSVTVVAPTAEIADALATYLFVVGYDAYMAEKPFPIHFMVIEENGQLRVDPVLAEDYQLELIP